MNIFRLVGDLSHLLAVIILVLKIWKTRSCAGISGKSQILFALVYTTRYLDLFTNFISIYNSIMKTVFIAGSYATIFLMYSKFKATYDHNHDTFRIEFLLIPVAGLSLLVNHDFTPLEVLWTFSIYLEAVAILPQLFLVSKTGEAETITSHYLFALGIYRALYILNWVYRYYMEGFFDLIAIIAGIVQTVLYCDFFYLYVTKGKFTIWIILYHGLEFLAIQILFMYYRVATNWENPQISLSMQVNYRRTPVVMCLVFGMLMALCLRAAMTISLLLTVLIKNTAYKKYCSDIKNPNNEILIDEKL